MRLSIQLVHQFLVFCIIGAINTAIDFGIYYMLTRYGGLGATRELLLLAVSIGFIAANIIGFFLHNRFTFSQESTSFTRNYSKYLIVSVLGLGLNVIIFAVLIYAFNTHDLIAKLITIAIIVWFSFVGNKLWAFRS